MNDFLDIFSDTLLIASFQPRQRERCPADQLFADTSSEPRHA